MSRVRTSIIALVALSAVLLPGAAQAQIAFRNASSALNEGMGVQHSAVGAVAAGTGATVTPGLPARTPGNLLLTIIEAGDVNAITMPSPNWTLLTSGSQGTVHQAAIFWRIATNTAADTATISHAAGPGARNVLLARVVAFADVDTANPFDGVTMGSSGGATNTVSTGTITTTNECSVLVTTVHISDDNTITTPPSGGWYQSFYNSTTTGNDAAISLWYLGATAAGLQPSQTITHSGADRAEAAQFALRPGGITLNVPTGTQAGDVMIASIATRPANSNPTNNNAKKVCPPAGWTLIRDTTNDAGGGTGGTGLRLQTYYRVATGGEPASYTWFTQVNNPSLPPATVFVSGSGGIVSYSGVDTTSPIDVEGGNTTPNSYSHTGNSINTTVANTMLVASHTFLSADTWNPDAMNERVDQSAPASPPGNAVGIALRMADEPRPTAGATGARTAVAGGTSNTDTGIVHMVALRPITFTHYAISGVTAGLTCAPSDVTITAHNTGHGTAFPPNGTVTTLSTSTGTGVWTSPLVSGPGTWTPSGLNNGSATYTWTGAESSFTARLRHNTPVTLSVNLSDGGGRTEDGAEDPSFTFVNTGFRVTADGTTTASIGTHIAGKNSNVGFGAQTLFLQAVRTDTNTGSCVGVFGSQTVTIEMAGARINPTGGASQVSVQNNVATMVPLATGAGAPAGYTSITLAFDAQSKAPLVFNYPDAGSISLHARYLLPSPPAATYMSGSSNTFVVRPFGLRISGVTSGATGPGDPIFAKAGANFNATVTAVRWKTGDDADANGVPDSDAQIAGNAATPNFGQEAAPASATMTHTLNAPGGGNAGTLGGTTTYTGFVAGARTQAISWSEVGIINLFAQSANYLGTGQTVRNSAAGLTGVGRFYPDHFFLLAGSTLTNRSAAACAPASAFTYLDEGFGLAFTLQARNTANVVTQNYTTASAFAKLNPATIASLDLGAMSGAMNLTGRLDTSLGSVGSFVAGAANVTATPGIRRASPDNPDGPFTAARVGIAPVDSDGVALRAADLNMDVDGVGGNDHQQVGANTEFRFGRLRMSNATGSEKLALSIPVQAQHWNGSGFVTNTLDSCTSIPRSAFALDFTPVSNLTPCETAMSAATLTMASGAATLTLTAPGAGNNGSVLVTANLGSAGGSYCNPGAYVAATNGGLSYLLGRWNDAANPDANPNTAYDDKPAARAAFGLYGSQPNNVIYMRENY